MKKKISVIAIATMLLVCTVAMCACTPSLDSLKQKYEDGYIVTEIDVDGVIKHLKNMGMETEEDYKIKYAFTAVKGYDNLLVVAFTNMSDAKDVYEALGGKENTRIKKKGSAVAVALSLGESKALEMF